MLNIHVNSNAKYFAKISPRPHPAGAKKPARGGLLQNGLHGILHPSAVLVPELLAGSWHCDVHCLLGPCVHELSVAQNG